MRDATFPWAVAGGWAIDLFLGFESRSHSDIEISIPARHFFKLSELLNTYEFCVASNGMVWPVVGAEETLADTYQTWVRESSTGVWRMDVFREPTSDNQWVYRGNPSITRPYHDVIRLSDDGIAYLSPETVLLFKAKSMLPKDEADFDRVLPLLDASPSQWLATALRTEYGDHPWIGKLAPRFTL